MKFTDDTTITIQISNNETQYQEEINSLAEWCTENNPLLKVSKTKELTVDFQRKEANTHAPV